VTENAVLVAVVDAESGVENVGVTEFEVVAVPAATVISDGTA
jgi:hypothetical protein